MLVAALVAFSGQDFPLSLVSDAFANGGAVWLGGIAFAGVIYLLYRWLGRALVTEQPPPAGAVCRRARHRTGQLPRIISAAFSAIMMVGALVLPPIRRGMTAASATRRPSMP